MDPCPLSLGGVVPKQFASPAVLAQEGVVLLQVLGRYGYHEPLQGVREGFGGSGRVVGHTANLYLIDSAFMEKNGNLYRIGCKCPKRKTKKMTTMVAKGKGAVSLTYKPTTKP
jgi:hypothetical protein